MTPIFLCFIGLIRKRRNSIEYFFAVVALNKPYLEVKYTQIIESGVRWFIWTCQRKTN